MPWGTRARTICPATIRVLSREYTRDPDACARTMYTPLWMRTALTLAGASNGTAAHHAVCAAQIYSVAAASLEAAAWRTRCCLVMTRDGTREIGMHSAINLPLRDVPRLRGEACVAGDLEKSLRRRSPAHRAPRYPATHPCSHAVRSASGKAVAVYPGGTGAVPLSLCMGRPHAPAAAARHAGRGRGAG